MTASKEEEITIPSSIPPEPDTKDAKSTSVHPVRSDSVAKGTLSASASKILLCPPFRGSPHTKNGARERKNESDEEQSIHAADDKAGQAYSNNDGHHGGNGNENERNENERNENENGEKSFFGAKDIMENLNKMEAQYQRMEASNDLLQKEVRGLQDQIKNKNQVESTPLLPDRGFGPRRTSPNEPFLDDLGISYASSLNNDTVNPQSTISFASEHGDNTNNMDALTSKFDEDVYTLMMISVLTRHNISWILGIWCYAFQVTLSTLILLGQLDASYQFDIPFTVDADVRIGQFLCMLFCLTYQTDILGSVQSIVLGGSLLKYSRERKDGNGRLLVKDGALLSWSANILLPNLFKLSEGTFVLVVTLIVIYTSDNIIDLLKDFTALMIVSETDDIVFRMAKYGYLGKKLQKMTKVSTRIEIDSGGTRWNGHLIQNCVFVLFFIATFGAWLVIVVNQIRGTFFDDRYPKCAVRVGESRISLYELAKENFGNGECYGGALNTIGCEFEGGDCINFNLAYPLCRGNNRTNPEEKVGNGHCDAEFSSIECNYDGGDCCSDAITSSPVFGDGQCHGGVFSSSGCGYDQGDCDAFRLAFGECKLDDFIEGANNIILGDGICDSGLYASKICGHEFGDCNIGQVSQDVSFEVSTDDISLNFDTVMSSDGTTLIVGFPDTPPNTTTTFEYDFIAKVWMNLNVATLHDKTLTDYGHTGRSIVMSHDGNRMAIGSSGSPNLKKKGMVQIFDMSRDKRAWIPAGNLLIGETARGRFGHTVDLNGDGSRLSVAEPYFSTTGKNFPGRIIIYEFNSECRLWEMLGDINGTMNEKIGLESLQLSSLDGSRVAFSCGDIEKSVTKIYEYNGIEWMPLGKGIEIEYTSSIAMNYDATTIALGIDSRRSDTYGQVRIFHFNTTDWIQSGNPLFGNMVTTGNGFGRSLAMTESGDLLAVSSINPGCKKFCSSGAVELFIRYSSSSDQGPSSPESDVYHDLLPRDEELLFKEEHHYAIEEQNEKRKTSIFGYRMSLSSPSDSISISGYNWDRGIGYIKTYDLDYLFYMNCSVPDPRRFGKYEKDCQPDSPYNTPYCGYNAGKCLDQTGFPTTTLSIMPSLVPSVSYQPTHPTALPTLPPALPPDTTARPSITDFPSAPPSSHPTIDNEIICSFHLLTDIYPQDVSWELRDNNDNVVKKGPKAGDPYKPLTRYIFNWPLNGCLPHTLKIVDSNNDGLISPGSFEVYINGSREKGYSKDGRDYGPFDVVSVYLCPQDV